MSNEYGDWIKLYRKMLDNPVVMKDGDHLAVWIYLLLKATWCPKDVMFKGERITLAPGQFTTGRKRIAEDLNISESKVQRVLKCFESEQMIEQVTDFRCRLISILAWDEHQSGEQVNEQVLNSSRTGGERVLNTNKEYKNIRNKESNIHSSENPSLKEEFETLWKLYPRKSGKKDALRHYVAARKKGTSYEDVFNGINAYREKIDREEIDPNFVKMGSTWFSKHSWEDDYSYGKKQTEDWREEFLNG